jgi:hypothetical protein
LFVAGGLALWARGTTVASAEVSMSRTARRVWHADLLRETADEVTGE